MSEADLAKDLLKLVLDAAGQAKLVRVSAIEAKGQGLSAEETRSLRLRWGRVSKGTLAEKSRLRLRPAPARASCVDCGWEERPGSLPSSPQASVCPKCGGQDLMGDSTPTFFLVSITGE